ncbi:MAG: Type-2 restriction enzyme KpnI [Nitrosomonadaceae bacterium]|nr:Type-2 restriction enzyme KpnI [Nitrosomonadaceae bacterium]
MKKLGSRASLRAFLLSNVGKVLTKDQLREAALHTSEWARRLRELRDEEGYRILSNNDLDTLKPGEYLLENDRPIPAFKRGISKEVRAFVLERNGNTCVKCGGVAGEAYPDNPFKKVRLHIGHRIPKSQGGPDTPENLEAVCSVCNEGLQNITIPRPEALELLVQIRRSTKAVQLEALQWLEGKYRKKPNKDEGK